MGLQGKPGEGGNSKPRGGKIFQLGIWGGVMAEMQIPTGFKERKRKVPKEKERNT
jgi:hypothetical protein